MNKKIQQSVPNVFQKATPWDPKFINFRLFGGIPKSLRFTCPPAPQIPVNIWSHHIFTRVNSGEHMATCEGTWPQNLVFFLHILKNAKKSMFYATFLAFSVHFGCPKPKKSMVYATFLGRLCAFRMPQTIFFF